MQRIQSHSFANQKEIFGFFFGFYFWDRTACVCSESM